MTQLPTYYTYEDPFPATKNDPYKQRFEDMSRWPKSYRYNSNQVTTQGIHPPGAVYDGAASWWQNYYGAQVSCL